VFVEFPLQQSTGEQRQLSGTVQEADQCPTESNAQAPPETLCVFREVRVVGVRQRNLEQFGVDHGCYAQESRSGAVNDLRLEIGELLVDSRRKSERHWDFGIPEEPEAVAADDLCPVVSLRSIHFQGRTVCSWPFPSASWARARIYIS